MRVGLLAGFLLKVILWLLPCLAVWALLGQYLALPVAWLAEGLVWLAFPRWAEGVELNGTLLALLTDLRLPPPPGTPADQLVMLTPEANYLTYGYGLPMLAALFLASRPSGLGVKLVLGGLALLPFQLASVTFDWLKQIAILSGPSIAGQASFGGTALEAIALGYQFGTLVLPTLVPVVLWLVMDRRLVSTLLVEAYLERAEPEPYSNREGSSRGE